jgi:putative solute:sodium symporter small subunit
MKGSPDLSASSTSAESEDVVTTKEGEMTEEQLRKVVEEKAQLYWKKNITFILSLLAVWALVSYVCGILLAEPLRDVYIGSLPFGFWFAQQGSILTFMVLILIYALRMDKMDKEFDVNE